MALHEGLYSKLINNGPVGALINNRVYPLSCPQEDRVFPKIIYELSNYSPVDSQEGASQLASHTIKLTLACRTYSQLQDLAQKVKNALHGSRETWGTTVVKGCFFEDESETVEFDDAGDDGKVYAQEQEYLCNFYVS